MSVTSGSQVLSLCHIEQNSIDEILPTFSLQVLFIYSNEQSSQFILSDEILLTFDLQVLSVCSNRQSSQSMMNNKILPTFDLQVLSIYSNKQNQEKLEIVSGLIFQTWKQLDSHIRMYTKQNGFVSIITCFESNNITHRRYQYACEHQGIGHSKKTAIIENQKQAYTKHLGCKYITSKNSLSKLASVLDSYLAQESMYIHYNNWSIAHIQPTHITVLAQLLPKVDKWLAEFLTEPVLSLQRAKIAEALWYSTKLVSKKSINISLL
ncbi:3197_t:CDS:2 [Gigaspora margarita]|uniref:3197_t:CDS:1 n=1 Tax=Gigaspora margarita TaxID=4874 RepID=A0ABN7W831_GIGMA|nr:3197_t:CDS:2 [Gigaspora margarita]